MATLVDKAFQERVARIETLITRIEASEDSAVRDSAVELVQAIMDLHGAGIERMMDMAWEKGEAGQGLIEEYAADDMLRSLLILHGLHPLDLETRVMQALDKVRPYLRSHGGNVEFLGVDEGGTVHLRLQGSCNGCASSAMTLKLAIEEAMHDFAPDIAGMDVEGVVPPLPLPASGFIPLSQVGGPVRLPASVGKWETLGDLSTLGTGATRGVDVAGRRVLLCNLEGTFYGYGSICPACGESIEAAQLKASLLACPGCGTTYDAIRAGRCLDHPDLHLEPFPVLEQHGKVRIALPQAVTG